MISRVYQILATNWLDPGIIALADTNQCVIECIDFISINMLDNTELREGIDKAFDTKSLIIFTSSNAVKAVHKLCSNEPESFVAACVGEKTKQLTEALFPQAVIKFSEANADLLAHAISNSNSYHSAVFFCGNIHHDILPDRLRKESVNIKEVVVYETQILKKQIAKKYDGILFFSPSAAEGYFEMNSPRKDTVLFAIGETTANKIRQLADHEIIIAPQPDKRVLTVMAIDHFKKLQSLQE